MNQKTKALTALIALAFSTAFAAASSIQTAALVPTIPVAQVRPVAPVTPQGVTVTPAATAPAANLQAGLQANPVCAPRPIKGQGVKNQAPRPGAAAAVTPGNTAPALKTPAAMKNASARPAADGKTPANGGLLGERHPGAQRPGGRGRADGRPVARQAPGTQAPGTQVTGAPRLQNKLTRITALLSSTTDARARGYLNDARTLAQSGNARAAHSLVRAAEAINRVQR